MSRDSKQQHIYSLLPEANRRIQYICTKWNATVVVCFYLIVCHGIKAKLVKNATSVTCKEKVD